MNGTIYDYMDWRGDLELKQSPLNLVDNVILSNLSYLDMKPAFGTAEDPAELAAAGTLPSRYQGQAARTLQFAVKCFFNTHTEEEIRKSGRPYREVPRLAVQAAESVRFQNICISDFIYIVDKKAEEQMSAMVFWLNKDTAYIAFGGTDSSIIGWKEDFSLSYLSETPGQRHAVEYLNRVFGENCPGNLYVGGHSKGGNLAVYASAFCDPAIRRRIKKVYSNDGPGFRPEITEREEYKKLLPKVIAILPDSSIIGTLLDSHARTLVISSRVSGFGQHDAFTWEVLGNRFVESERSPSGRFYDEFLQRWIGSMTDRQRHIFTDALFDLIEAGGDSLNELKAEPMRAALEMIKASVKMDEAARAELPEILKQLAASGAETLKGVLQ